ncbi:YggT family protein [Utexia brackfieldae]|uniref:YggT family protein n=1 Tax=Utexia brackfieldae TaxID=3074108 RepID=UPI00370D94FB
MASIFYIINTLLTICLYIFMLRSWMQYARVNFYNPFTQFIVKITQPILGPLKKVLPYFKKFDSATFLVIYVIALIKVMFICAYGLKAPLFNVQYLLFAVYAILHAIGHLIFWLLLVRAILSWISRGQSSAEDLLFQLTEPLVQSIRRIIPPLGNIDLSFMVVVFILFALNMLATDLFGFIWLLM